MEKISRVHDMARDVVSNEEPGTKHEIPQQDGEIRVMLVQEVKMRWVDPTE